MKDRQRIEAQTTNCGGRPIFEQCSRIHINDIIRIHISILFAKRFRIVNSTRSTTRLAAESEASAIPETLSSFVYQQRELVTEDDTDNEPLFGINILPLAASSRRGPVQTTN